ncbi:MAG: hypothetical protein LBS59_08560 [Puniceicoccales bacterium]|nr:hypothetical protein [Puniceicoccales bacterium]
MQLLEVQECLLQFYREQGAAGSLTFDKMFEGIFQKIENVAQLVTNFSVQMSNASDRNMAVAFRQQLVGVRLALLQFRREQTIAPVVGPLPEVPVPEMAVPGLVSLPEVSFDAPLIVEISPQELPPVSEAGDIGAVVEKVQNRPLRLPSATFQRPNRILRWFRNFGLDGFGISIMVHAILILVAVFWVVARHVIPEKEIPINFVTGSGGGEKGNSPRDFSHKTKSKRIRPVNTSHVKISAKSASNISLPEIPIMELTALQGTQGVGELSKGLGGGAGGGQGTGLGPGIGDGRNMVSRLVMGVRMKAKKIAVYLDNSGSMVPYLENVKKEIYASYPDADIFEIMGIVTHVNDGVVLGGRRYKLSPARKRAVNKVAQTPGQKPVVVSKSYEKILRKWGAHFRVKSASIGAWMDIMMFEKYDALVVFSDFQDGVIQRVNKTVVFQEKGVGAPDNREAVEKKWEEEWLARFSDKKNGPRLYLFSIQMQPQTIWQKCVKASGGAIKMMPELRRQVTKEARQAKRAAQTRASPKEAAEKTSTTPPAT